MRRQSMQVFRRITFGLLWIVLAAACSRPRSQPTFPATSTPTFPMPPSPAAVQTLPVSPVETTALVTAISPVISPTRAGDPVAPDLPSPLPPPFTPLADVFQGAVQIQNGLCCLGGVVGASVKMSIAFAAHSPTAPVVQMRYRIGGFCLSAADLESEPWQTYRSSLVLDYPIHAINWVGAWVAVQFRDSSGNLSPVACDDISVEGMPSAPPP